MLLRDGTFEGKVALVTGGGTGLGFEISRGLLALGAKTVVVASRNPDHHERIQEAASEYPGELEAMVLDVREPDRVDEAFLDVARRHGGLDVVVCNAAGNFFVPSMRLKPKGWRAVIDIALSGTFYCAQSAGRIMAKSGGGSIVTIGATYAWTGMPGVVHSAAAKAGVLALTRTLAVEWAPQGIRINCVVPGAFHSGGAEKNLWPDENIKEAIENAIPLKRLARLDEVVDAVLYVASPQASYITGESLVIDGGAWLGKGLWSDAGDR